jgi:DNA-directed RNA polymerase subunit RPC12/RpoP
MRQWLNKLNPKKVLVCTQCQTKFRFPVKPGKTLNVTCPSCNASYQISFVNPLVQLLKGRLNWATLSQTEKKKLIVLFATIVIAFGLIVTSFINPIKPSINQQPGIEHVL